MITTIAIAGYRSLRSVVVPLAPLTVVTGANGTGKSSLYRALRLLAGAGRGEVVGALAREGGLESALWAGPESLAGVRRGAPLQGTVRTGPISLLLGYAGDDFGYLVDLGLPQPSAETAFGRDPLIKREVVFTGEIMRPGSVLVKRLRGQVQVRDGEFTTVTDRLGDHRSMLLECADPVRTPELVAVRERLRSWRFYDGFRSDAGAPARQAQVGTRTPVLADDGGDLGAAIQTILEDGRIDLPAVIDDAFPGSRVAVGVTEGRFEVRLHQPGLLRALRAAELSDGTLRYLLWAAALCSPQPPPLMVLNEPETSIHPDLIPALARLILEVSTRTQVLVVSHSRQLAEAVRAEPLDFVDDLARLPPAVEVHLAKAEGETVVDGLGLLRAPRWEWGSRR